MPVASRVAYALALADLRPCALGDDGSDALLWETTAPTRELEPTLATSATAEAWAEIEIRALLRREHEPLG